MSVDDGDFDMRERERDRQSEREDEDEEVIGCSDSFARVPSLLTQQSENVLYGCAVKQFSRVANQYLTHKQIIGQIKNSPSNPSLSLSLSLCD